MSKHICHTAPVGDCHPHLPFKIGELNYTAEQINQLLSLIPLKMSRDEVKGLMNFNTDNYIGHVPSQGSLTPQKTFAWAFVGELDDAIPFFYYTPDFVPEGYKAGWNDMFPVFGSYNLVPDKSDSQIVAEEAFKVPFRLPELIADRALKDENGNRIVDTYVTRMAVAKHIERIFNSLFLENPPLIMEGYITPEMLSEETRQMLESTGQEITNLPDGEDLTSVHGVLKLANKQHNPNSYSGLGRQYLRKNIVAGVNVLTQSMMQWPNTIYIIQYDYDLQGAEITVPEGCVLDFQGGSFKNGVISNIGSISNEANLAIFKNIEVIAPQEQEVKLKWFDYTSVSYALQQASKFKHVDCVGTWVLDGQVLINNDIELYNGFIIAQPDTINILIKPDNVIVKDYNETIPSGSLEIATSVNDLPFTPKAVLIRSSDKFYWTGPNTGGTVRRALRGELMLIKKINDNSIVFNSQIGTVCDYDTDITVTYYTPIMVNIHNCSFFIDKLYEKEVHEAFISVHYGIATVKDCDFNGGMCTGIGLHGCYNSSVSDCNFTNVNPWCIIFSGGTAFSTVTNCRANKTRHLWTTGGEDSVPKFNLVTGNVCTNALYGICSHAAAYNTTISNNILEDCEGGVGSYGPNCIITGNIIRHTKPYNASSIILIEAGGVNCVITNNIIDGKEDYNEVIRNYSFRDDDYNYIRPKYCIVKNNVIKNCKNASAIICRYDTTDNVKITISGNEIYDFDYTPIQVEGDVVEISNNILRDGAGRYLAISAKAKGNVVNKVLSLMNNSIYGAHNREGKSVLAEGYKLVYERANLIYPDNDSYTYIDCEKVDRIVTASPKENGLIKADHVKDDISFNNNGYVKIGNFKGRYKDVALYVDTVNFGNRLGGSHFIKIATSSSNEIKIKAYTLQKDGYTDFKVYYDSDFNVYIGKLQFATITWTFSSGGRNKENINEYIESLPEDVNIITPYILDVERKFGDLADAPTTNLWNGIDFYARDLGIPVWYNGHKYVGSDGLTPALHRGYTENRPNNLSASDDGFQYYDRTLKKIIWWTGTNWVDATGAEV